MMAPDVRLPLLLSARCPCPLLLLLLLLLPLLHQAEQPVHHRAAHLQALALQRSLQMSSAGRWVPMGQDCNLRGAHVRRHR